MLGQTKLEGCILSVMSVAKAENSTSKGDGMVNEYMDEYFELFDWEWYDLYPSIEFMIQTSGRGVRSGIPIIVLGKEIDINLMPKWYQRYCSERKIDRKPGIQITREEIRVILDKHQGFADTTEELFNLSNSKGRE